MDAALLLGVSQVELETGYYMVDLPELLIKRQQRDVRNRLEALEIATVARTTSQDVYERFVAQLKSEMAPAVEEQDRFDAGALRKLRAKVQG